VVFYTTINIFAKKSIMKKQTFSHSKNFLMIDYQGISKQVNLENDDYICLNDLLEFFPNKKLDNWQRLKSTKEFIELVEKILNQNYDPSHVRDHSEEIEAIYTIKGNFKDGRKQGTYAHELVALEFLTWLSPEFKLMVLLQWNRWRKNQLQNLASKEFVVAYVDQAVLNVEAKIREFLLDEYLDTEHFNRNIDFLDQFSANVWSDIRLLTEQHAKLQTQIEALEQEVRQEGKALVYLFYNPTTDEYKLGFSEHIKARLHKFKEVEPNMQKVLTIVAESAREALLLESWFKKRFETKRTHGEWFKLNSQDISKIEAFAVAFGEN
jgi:Holliday junction resolvase